VAGDLNGRIVFEDCDNSHFSKEANAWKKRHGIDWIVNASKSPDLSAVESLIARLEEPVYRRRTATEESTWNRLKMVSFDDEMVKPKWVNNWVDGYRGRLRQVLENSGKDTQYQELMDIWCVVLTLL
jgi:hypothetical protein